mgnify:FL=1|jgi:hypothetical protein|tara:strand:+ start:1224 stop:1331 length:108 start_codon:yes stop_codon:yes gene_type:complete
MQKDKAQNDSLMNNNEPQENDNSVKEKMVGPLTIR